MTKKLKAPQNVIETREDLEAAIGRIAANQSARNGLLANLEEEINNIRAVYEPRITAYGAKIAEDFDAAQIWAEENAEVFASKKSLDCMHGTIGFRTGQPRLKLLAGRTWGRVLELLALNRLTDYIREKQEPDKERLLADRQTLTDERLKLVGLKVVQDETFFVDPKREEVGDTIGKVAGLLIMLALPFLGGCYTPTVEERMAYWAKQSCVQQMRMAAALERMADVGEGKQKSVVSSQNPKGGMIHDR